jgi:hypothetical protein
VPPGSPGGLFFSGPSAGSIATALSCLRSVSPDCFDCSVHTHAWRSNAHSQAPSAFKLGVSSRRRRMNSCTMPSRR